jgi:dynein heavy chain
VDLQKRIHSSFDEAQDNLKFLKILEEPCRKIEKAHPSEIPKLLPDVLSAVRIIWELSGNYSSEERMKGLLTKISNQIIQRCRAKINKEDMLGNDVEKCMRDLDESIDCCQQWREICTKAQRRIQEHSDKKSWDMENMSAIFAENEAFIQRCKELKEICEG